MGNYGEAFGAAVAKQLQAERAVAKLSQKRLGELAGMSEQSVMRYLNGVRDIPMTALADLSEAMGLSVEAVIDRAIQRMPGDDNVIVGRFGQNAEPTAEERVAYTKDEESGEDLDQ